MNLETKLDPRLWDSIRETYEARNFTSAILDAMHFLSDLLRERTGLESDGAALVGEAFGGNSPKLKVNALRTESERNVQKGLEQLVRGMYQAVRNPRSHGKVSDSEDEAQAIILFVNYLVKLIGESQAPFSKSAFVARVFDPDFVASERYAKLLVNQIPAKKRLEVFLEVYRLKTDGKGDNLRFFFAALLEELQEDENQSVYQLISEELQQTDDDQTIRTIIQAFDASIWPLLEETARLRIENKLLRSIRSGKYVVATEKCRAGSLGTWATGLFPYFTLKNETLSTIIGKLRSEDPTDQDYVFRYLMYSVDSLVAAPSKGFELALMKGLASGDKRFNEALDQSYLWNDEKWSPEMKKVMDQFQEVEPTPELTDEDIPF